MATIAVTGSASGIGRATRERLEASGQRVIGVDLADAEVVADLSTASGRAAMVEGVTRASEGVLDGLVAAAGVGGTRPATLVASVNYFGAVATAEGLRPLLARGTDPSAVVVASNSMVVVPRLPHLAEACLAGDEADALAHAEKLGGKATYATVKLALARWVRRAAVSPEWIGQGIRLNAIAPGVTETPLTGEGTAESFLELGDRFPVPIARVAQPAEIAAPIEFLLSKGASFFCGSVVFVDGGTEAKLRGEDWPAPRD